jgi:phosphoribosylamine-glycine ligase
MTIVCPGRAVAMRAITKGCAAIGTTATGKELPFSKLLSRERMTGISILPAIHFGTAGFVLNCAKHHDNAFKPEKVKPAGKAQGKCRSVLTAMKDPAESENTSL